MIYDLRGATGRMLKEEKKVRFDNLDLIRRAYKAVANDDSEKVFKKYQAIGIVEAVRNLFAHRAGIVDAAFLARVKNVKEFNAFKQGDMLTISVPQVNQYIDILVKCSVELFLALDRLVQQDAKKP